MHHQAVVGSQMDVQFDAVGAELPGALERRQRVFGCVGAGAAMRHDGHPPGHAAEHLHVFRGQAAERRLAASRPNRHCTLNRGGRGAASALRAKRRGHEHDDRRAELDGSWIIARDDPGVAWLLTSAEPAVRMLTLKEVLGEAPDHPDVVAAREAFVLKPIARALLNDHGEPVYAKWPGPFWRLTALVELGVPAGEPTASGYLRTVLAWLNDMEHRRYPPIIAGRPRAHAIWHGQALAAAVALSTPDPSVAAALAEQLIQWPDGGWNCDRRPDAACSSVHESLGPCGALRRIIAPRAIRWLARRSGGPPNSSSSAGCSDRGALARSSIRSGCSSATRPTTTTTCCRRCGCLGERDTCTIRGWMRRSSWWPVDGAGRPLECERTLVEATRAVRLECGSRRLGLVSAKRVGYAEGPDGPRLGEWLTSVRSLSSISQA